MKKAKKVRNNNSKSFPSDVDVVITDHDPASHMTTPGTYTLMDLERGVMETIEVAHDGAKRVVKSQPMNLAGLSREPVVATESESLALRVLAVGQRYHPEMAGWQEGVQINISPGGVEVGLFLDGPTRGEIEAVRGGRVAMRLIKASQTMVFLIRFGNGPWQEAFFSVHRVQEAFRGCPPDPGQGYGWLATIVVVNARNGVVAAIRPLALSREFSCAILRAFEEQAGRAADDDAHVREAMRFGEKSTAALAEEPVRIFV